MDFQNVFCSRLSLLMQQRGRRAIAGVSRIVGVSPQTMRKYMKGLSYPPLDVAYQMAQLFHVSLDFLAGNLEGGQDNVQYVPPVEEERD